MSGRNIKKAVAVNSRRLRSTANPQTQPQEPSSEIMTVTASALDTTNTSGENSNSNETSLLLKMLPTEMRENVWIKVVTTNSPIHSHNSIQSIHIRLEKYNRSKKPFMSLPAEKSILAIARTCKRIHDEVMPIYVSPFFATYPLFSCIVPYAATSESELSENKKKINHANRYLLVFREFIQLRLSLIYVYLSLLNLR